ncbi:T9SS type A sorting domain-containing protein [Mesonia ostreae]|uniref:T9SS type A sorting domain-containing protein n=1 Tax=Mesonia ostreae TaxID=861110 RepID=A0ABU2KGB2_9FLAO|nr:T9SS type A sorting domain-containing protein [Mesonia ostreae]MDT0293745.1 T9SS type A sorting domain-containing protein [Mesonia ostreae]
MKYISTFFCFFIAATTFAQLTVKPTNTQDSDNYVYVDGTVLFVKQQTNLIKNNDTLKASLYLRNEAQLIQATDATSNNTGNGVMSVFQEGTSDNFEYNYWSSPVGIPVAQPGNAAFGAGSLKVPQDRLISTSITDMNYNGDDGTASPFKIAKKWINTYVIDINDYANWTQVQFERTINAGEGFTMKGTSGTDPTTVHGVQNNPGSAQRYDFRGRPHNGSVTPTLLAPNDIALVGNPYPSALDLNYFLLENSGSGTLTTACNVSGIPIIKKNSTSGIAYFWDMDKTVDSHNLNEYNGGYGAYSPNNDCSGMGTYVPPTFFRYNDNGEIVNSGNQQAEGDTQYRRFLPIAQGFFVKAPAMTGAEILSVSFSNRHRVFVKEGVANQSYFDRPTSESYLAINENLVISNNVLPKLRLNIAFDDLYTRQLALAFNDNASPAIEPAMDAINLDGISSDAGFLHQGDSYIIDTRPFDIEDRLPLYLNLSSQRDLSFRINNFENFDTENVYIYDKQTEEYHSVKDTYFYISLPAGDYSDRFELTFKNTNEDLEVSEEIASSFDVFQNNTNAQLSISNPLQIDLNSIEVFDMTGKRILSSMNLNTQSQYTYPTSKFAQGVYVVRITTKDNISTTKKISIFKGR